MTASLSRTELEKKVAAYRGNPLFADLAAILRTSGEKTNAIDICLAGLTSNPSCHKGRLMLARLYYDCGYLPFCIRELKILNQELPKSSAVKKLLDLLAPDWEAEASAKPQVVSKEVNQVENTLAEADFEIDVLSDLEKDKSK